jgi:hypothetical protein
MSNLPLPLPRNRNRISPSYPHLLLLILLTTITTTTVHAQNTLSSITAQYNLNAATFNYSVPSTALGSDDAQGWIRNHWDLTGKIAFGGNDMYVDSSPPLHSVYTSRRFLYLYSPLHLSPYLSSPCSRSYSWVFEAVELN